MSLRGSHRLTAAAVQSQPPPPSSEGARRCQTPPTRHPRQYRESGAPPASHTTRRAPRSRATAAEAWRAACFAAKPRQSRGDQPPPRERRPARQHPSHFPQRWQARTRAARAPTARATAVKPLGRGQHFPRRRRLRVHEPRPQRGDQRGGGRDSAILGGGALGGGGRRSGRSASGRRRKQRSSWAQPDHDDGRDGVKSVLRHRCAVGVQHGARGAGCAVGERDERLGACLQQLPRRSRRERRRSWRRRG